MAGRAGRGWGSRDGWREPHVGGRPDEGRQQAPDTDISFADLPLKLPARSRSIMPAIEDYNSDELCVVPSPLLPLLRICRPERRQEAAPQPLCSSR